MNVLITGAGGSIGSELCRQIIKLNPSKIILLELSEIALYKIDKELKANSKNSTKIRGYLGDSCDKNLLRYIFKKNEINIIFHAAAYKHVPIVEMNPLIGLKNNVFSTKAICEISKEFNPSKVILISTDKAVRPTNIMGASKRLAELIVQVYAMENEEKRSMLMKTKHLIVYQTQNSQWLDLEMYLTHLDPLYQSLKNKYLMEDLLQLLIQKLLDTL